MMVTFLLSDRARAMAAGLAVGLLDSPWVTRLVRAWVLVLWVVAAGYARQDGPTPGVRALVDGLVGALESEEGERIRPFIAEHFDSDYLRNAGSQILEARLEAVRRSVGTVAEVSVERTEEGIVVLLAGAGRARIALAFDADDRPLVTRMDTELSTAAETTPADLEDAYRIRARAVEALGVARDQAAVEAFVRTHVDPVYAETDPELVARLERLGRIAASAGGVIVALESPFVTLKLRGPENADVRLRIVPRPPYLLDLVEVVPVDGNAEETVEAITWENLEQRLASAEAEGVSGVVLIRRGGEILLRRALGLADHTTGRPMSPDLAFDIGSIPIDFTRAAVEMLALEGRLRFDDPISRFFSGVPDDKRAMTVAHLLEGSSGLPNFHHIPGKDADYDLTYIDRAEAVERILGRRLLFAPGEGKSHSHSAFGLLAAIVEVVSDRPFATFLRERLLEPAGMRRTGFYGESARFSAQQMAVGAGGSVPSSPNIPLSWGPTSWLVMGSGGMVSTADDLSRWLDFARANQSGEREMRVSMGDTDRGFLALLADRPGTTVIFLSNRHGSPDDPAARLARSLIGLVENE